MKILFLSTSDLAGGAAVAAYRLFRALAQAGEDVKMEVQYKHSDDPLVNRPPGAWGRMTALARRPLDTAWVQRRYPKTPAGSFMPARLPDGLASRIATENPDIVHLHWVGHGFMRPETLKRIRRPLVWTLHDMWSLTGGCYYDGGCGRYRETCGCCPVLGSNSPSDLSHRSWKRKANAWRDVTMTLVCPSKWLARCAAASSLHRNRRIEVIPYGLNTQLFKPWPRTQAREMLGLPQDRVLLLFGSSGSLLSPRKGFPHLQQALAGLSAAAQKIPLTLVVFGGHIPTTVAAQLAVPSLSLGILRDELSLALAYSASDIFIAPSIEDNLPNTALEAAACGLPVIAFNSGGLPEIVEDQVTGMLAPVGNAPELAKALSHLLSEPSVRIAFGHAARRRASMDYDAKLQAERYQSLYWEIGDESRCHGRVI